MLQVFLVIHKQINYILSTCLKKARETHKTFEDYCRDRWDMQRRYAYYMIDAASVIENVNHGSQAILPTSERQARPLTKLEPEQQVQTLVITFDYTT